MLLGAGLQKKRFRSLKSRESHVKVRGGGWARTAFFAIFLQTWQANSSVILIDKVNVELGTVTASGRMRVAKKSDWHPTSKVRDGSMIVDKCVEKRTADHEEWVADDKNEPWETWNYISSWFVIFVLLYYFNQFVRGCDLWPSGRSFGTATGWQVTCDQQPTTKSLLKHLQHVGTRRARKKK